MSFLVIEVGVLLFPLGGEALTRVEARHRQKSRLPLTYTLTASVFAIDNGMQLLGQGLVPSDECHNLITSYHVVARHFYHCEQSGEPCPSLSARNALGDELVVQSIVDYSEPLDAVVLSFRWLKRSTSRRWYNPKVTLASRIPQQGESVSLLAVLNAFSDTPFYVGRGLVAKEDYDHELRPSFNYEFKTFNGLSGSPIIDANGTVVGVHHGRRPRLFNDSSEPVPDGQKQAIPMAFIKDALQVECGL